MSQPPITPAPGHRHAVEQVLLIARDARFSDEFLGIVVRSYVEDLAELLAPDTLVILHSKMTAIPNTGAAANPWPDIHLADKDRVRSRRRG